MNLFPFLSLLASTICFTFGLTVHFLSKKKLLNIVFMLMCTCIAYWAFTDFMLKQAQTYETASFWLKLGFLWPFTSAFMFHFSIVFSGRKGILGNRITVFLVYFISSVFSVLELTTDIMTGNPVIRNGVYTYSIPEFSLFFWAGTFWLFMLSVLGLYILTQYCLTQTKSKRKRAELVTWGFSFPILISLLAEIFPYILKINIPDLSAISTASLCVFVGIAIIKYDLFTLDMVSASGTIVATMPDSVVLVDSTAKILSINHRLVSLLGHTKIQLVSKPVKFLFDPQSGSTISDALSIQQEIKNYQAICTTKYGEQIPVSVSTSVVYNDDHDVVGSVVVVRDITEKKEMETRVLKTEKMAALGQAATMVGHDLRNPLQAIQNATYCIKSELTRNSVGGSRFAASFRMLEIIEEAVGYSNNIVMDLKDFSTERKPELRPHDVSELIKNALESIKLSENVELLTDFGTVPPVNIDKAMIKRVLVNLLTNGFQAMPGGGTFRILTADMDEFVMIQFQDTGVGMSQKTLEKLFTPFFTTKAQGMGMGLAICKKFISLNGGCIDVHSEEGKGTTFAICLPVASNQVCSVNQN
jgi:PAS domain S-box-containing protein